MTSKNPHIIIVGAGVSGIAAASKLFENGYTKLTILEAENRIGGRINSVKSSPNLIELGAQWCHGEVGNVVYHLVKNLNVLGASFNTYSDLKYYDSSGKQIDKTLTDKLFGIFAEIAFEDDEDEDESEDKETVSTTEPSFGEYFLKRYNEEVEKSLNGDSYSKKIASNITNWFHNFMLCIDGAYSWFDLGISHPTAYKECDGNLLLHWKNHGFSTILDVLMKKYPNPSEALPIYETIHFGKEVRNIFWNGDEVKVKCSDESSYVGDHVIFTSSLGVLKETHKEMFVPQLPLYKQNAITGLGIGTVNKIFLRFPYKWWPDDCPGFSLVWNEEDKLKIANEFPYGPAENGKSWLEDIFGFYVLDNDSRTLMGWNVGSLVREVELLSDDVVLNGCLYILNKFLASQYEIPTTVQITRSKWYSNKHFRGSYSYRSVDSDRNNVCAEDLARPLSSESGNLTLLFAGEATHSHFYSSVHGALESGFREANRIIDMHTRPEERSCNVAVIGCGLAGLGAAHTFLEAGVEDILIVEALNEPGGRINTLSINGSIIELGAQWLHGSSNYLYKLALENELLLAETSEEGLGLYVRNDGLIFDEFFVKKIDFIIGGILEKCEKFVDSEIYPFSVGEFLEKEFNRYLKNCGESFVFKGMAMELYDWHYRFQVIDNSCLDLNEVSAKDWGKYSCLGMAGQKHMNIKNGYKSLIDILVKKLPKDALLLETPVLKIDYNSNHKIYLKCRGGINITANHVIVTPSIGVLKENLIQFHPKLPEKILTTVQSLGFHGMGKVYLVFEKKWWKSSGFQLIWKKDSILANDRNWIRHLTGFDVVLNQPNMLVGWIGGKGIEMMERLPEETLGRHCVEILRMFLKKPDIPLPTKVIRSTWTSCPWVRGAYSHTTPACDRADCGPATLSVPVEIDGVPRVLFAGEGIHTSHFSTTHGAFESGQEQAKVILKFLRRNKL